MKLGVESINFPGCEDSRVPRWLIYLRSEEVQRKGSAEPPALDVKILCLNINMVIQEEDWHDWHEKQSLDSVPVGIVDAFYKAWVKCLWIEKKLFLVYYSVKSKKKENLNKGWNYDLKSILW